MLLKVIVWLVVVATALTNSVEAKVERIERLYRTYGREHLAILDSQTGRVVEALRGDWHSVKFSINVCREVDYPIMTHNHPWGLYYTPSADDVETAMRCDVEQMRVASWDAATGLATLCLIERNPGRVEWPMVFAADMTKDYQSHEGAGLAGAGYKAVTDAWVRFWIRFAASWGYRFECREFVQ